MSDIILDDLHFITSYLKKELMQLQGKKIFIAGASGMLASYIVKTLLYANEHLFRTNAKLYLVIRKKIKPFGQSKYINYLHSDIASPTAQLSAIKNIDYLIHAASPAAPKIYLQNRVETLRSNILGLFNLLNLANSKTKSFLYFSTSEIYGNPQQKESINENYFGLIDHLSPRSNYVEAKKICETICMNYFIEKKTPIKIARIFHTFGPGLNLEDGRVFSDFIKNGLAGNTIDIKGNKKATRSLLYLKDATIMFLKILLSKKNGQIYNVGNDKNTVSVQKMAEIVASIVNGYSQKKIRVTFAKKPHIKYYANAPLSIKPNIQKFVNAFGYRPSTDVATAFSRTLSYYRARRHNE